MPCTAWPSILTFPRSCNTGGLYIQRIIIVAFLLARHPPNGGKAGIAGRRTNNSHDTTSYFCLKLARQPGLEKGALDDGAQNDIRGHNSAYHDLPTAKNQLGFPKAAARQRPQPFRFVGCPTAGASQVHPDISQGWASYKPRGRKPRGQSRPEFNPCGYGDLRLPGSPTKLAWTVSWVFLE